VSERKEKDFLDNPTLGADEKSVKYDLADYASKNRFIKWIKK
jgi:hypothetical protein